MPKISVIVPVYKTEPYLRRCVDSILTQTFTDFELLLVEDGSPDSCGRICDEYAAMDQRVRVFHQTNQGQAAARNHALDWVFTNSDSKYIGFVDSDDWVHPRYLELLLEGIERYAVNICQCEHLETDGTKEIPAAVSVSFNCVYPEDQYTQHYSAFMWDKLFTRSCWAEIRFPEGQIYEDLAIWYRMLFSQEAIAIVNAVLYYYYRNSKGTMRQDWHPGMLARMEAWDAQIAFFNQYGDEKLIKAAVKRYCATGLQEYHAISRSKVLTDSEKKKYQALLKSKFQRVVMKYHKEMKNNEDYPWFFERAFPGLNWLYWTARGVRNKIMRKK